MRFCVCEECVLVERGDGFAMMEIANGERLDEAVA